MSTVEKNIVKRRVGWLFAIFLIGTIPMLQAQQDAQYTQYMYNTVSVNPAYAGSRGHLSIAALYRNQWLGLDGAPETQTLNVHTPMGYRGVGLGLSIVNDKIGPTSETYFDVDFSYTIQTSWEGRLSFGLKASAHMLDIRYSELDEFEVDPQLQSQQDIRNKFSPNIGAGVYYHTDRFYVGLSAPRILETTHFDESSVSTAKEQINMYLITGYVWDLNPFLKFKPTLLTKAVQGAPLQVDLSANFMLNEKFIGGVAYRWDAAFSGLFGFMLSDQLMLGLAYDREITELGAATFNDGSFEVIIRYDFIRNIGNLKSPRFF
ncbi:type IX secretion system membrane protein PorP/SprF [Flagellimonas taeanensis]|uniref:Type IX secretion system membrane protein, PorP/SprF family n=1 Tax=Flagellimonas taeanensis TaxID=1005926 RepID=A0A1M6W2W1_9FLAO|nr:MULTISPECIES: type IX secretion system membrane protein PorP/SprF [Allomuricauda]MDC6386673.1 type IX secretion system membrane protein PorP/SprF [Muricauda sp. SK9]MEE1964465.1 type IX secretion system membrane protein PorP/SprF [Allomuricauda taeanensis]RIV50022.1 type IX secretion system membrane protein PorP/SprF [Allomuricauda taeanensis]SFC46705.1 type IX secretion system membrane protein, PorP/SprF family [Allomuricauda taeanensis]SHK87988.1 type IX secretion system membrane protein,